MIDFYNVLTKEEVILFSLRALYKSYGFSKYSMSKFEEYDLYANNKDFLVSENVITFTDTNGKLLALKPDVTLSIIKNSKDIDGVLKVFYNENVYRVSKNNNSYKEIMQTGVECLGDLQNEDIATVLELAYKSLGIISNSSVLEVSDLDIVSGVIDYFGITGKDKKDFLTCLGEKNYGGVKLICKNCGLDDNAVDTVCELVSLYGAQDKVLDKLDKFMVNDTVKKAINDFKDIIKKLVAKGIDKNVIIDFSVISDINYYNGIAFKGFVEGVPTGVLSGGQYGNLMAKMGKKAKAIGFAVYMDELSRLQGN